MANLSKKDLEKRFQEKLKDTVTDLKKAHALFKMIDIEQFEIKPDDSEEVKEEKMLQQEEQLSQLGRIAELVLKYLLKIRQTELYPAETYEDFSKTPIFSNKKLKDWIKLMNDHFGRSHSDKSKLYFKYGETHLSTTEEDQILNFFDENGQKFHNFTYLFLIIEKLMPAVYQNMQNVLNYKIYYDARLETGSYSLEALFPSKSPILYGPSHYEILQKRDNIKSTAGDIFTRMRYYSNNPSGRTFDLKEVYKFVEALVIFSKQALENNHNLLISAQVIFIQYAARELASKIGRTKEEVDEIIRRYSHDDLELLISVLLNPGHSFEEIDEIKQVLSKYSNLPLNGINYRYILSKAIKPNELEVLLKNGITNEHVMDKIIFSQLKMRRTIEQISNIINTHRNLNLLEYVSLDDLIELNKYPELANYFQNNKDILRCIDVGANIATPTLKQLLQLDELRKFPYLLYSLDESQTFIYKRIKEILRVDKKYACFPTSFSVDNTLKNIKENIKRFGGNPSLVYHIPLRLNPTEITNILNLLIANGLDITNMNINFDSTILCMPYKYVEMIINIMKEQNLPVICSNNINPNFKIISNEFLKKLAPDVPGYGSQVYIARYRAFPTTLNEQPNSISKPR